MPVESVEQIERPCAQDPNNEQIYDLTVTKIGMHSKGWMIQDYIPIEKVISQGRY